ncbi:MAG: carboxy terminal-processing peptidase [Flavobacteriales bacterium]|nr:carboxy terminal-processing peptidase [Flavobacteriales bacterium]
MNTILQFMKRNYKVLLVVLALSVGLWSFIPKTNAEDPEKDKLLIELLTYVLEKGHYSPKTFDDELSKGIYKDYIEALDPSKRYFLQSDIDEFAKYEMKIDDQILEKKLDFFDLTYNRLVQRMNETKPIYEDILDKPFDFTIAEDIDTDYEKLPYAQNKKDLNERWRKQLKLTVLSNLADKLKMQDDAKAGIVAEKSESEKSKYDKMTQAQKDKIEKTKTEILSKSYADLEKESRESSLKSLNEYFTFVKELERKDWFSVYINAITARFDPHTSYFAPEEKERFDISMSGKLEGIGARLQKKNDFTEITELILGGPAWRGKELEAGDIVLKVAQADGEPIEVVGMRLDDVVKKIKGPKGTEVRLTVKKADGTIKVITIIRDEVEIEETYAKSCIIDRNGVKYGIIYLPKFYIDFENKDSRDAGKDIAIEVERLKAEGVQGIVMDVRDNGGGSLKTVVDIAGLFIDQGPIVQIQSAAGKKEVLSDKDPKIQWDGPLVIMQNSFSASASEILAAAMQDYKRAVIIGSKQSYGKGTVQNVIDLNQFIRGSDYGDLGALKTTTQKFYRINGGSTQLEGVTSDVFMPDQYSYLKMGERDIENAMPWDKIAPANYKTWDKSSNFDAAIANSKMRIANNPQFKLIDEYAKWSDIRRNENVYSLQLQKFRDEQKKLEEANKKFKSLKDYTNQLPFATLDYEKELLKSNLSLKEKREDWFQTLSNDIYIEEAIRVLDDLQPNSGFKKGLTSKDKKEKLIKS